MMLFHTIVVAMCAIRSPTEVTVVLTYFSILLRLLMVFGPYCDSDRTASNMFRIIWDAVGSANAAQSR